MAIFREGPVIGAVASTGGETWVLRVLGRIPKNNTWTNYALRWSPVVTQDNREAKKLVRKAGGDVSVLGGLQLFMNREMIGMVVVPDDTSNKYQEYWPLDPPILMLGCHKTTDNPNFR